MDTPLALLFSLIDALGSSALARQAENGRLKAALEALRSSLLSARSNALQGESGINAFGQFSNAASDLFCEVKLQSSVTGRAQLEVLAQSVESVLSSIQRNKSISEQESSELLEQLNAGIARLK